MRRFERLTQISGSLVRLTIGIGGAALVFLALKDSIKRGASSDLILKTAPGSCCPDCLKKESPEAYAEVFNTRITEI